LAAGDAGAVTRDPSPEQPELRSSEGRGARVPSCAGFPQARPRSPPAVWRARQILSGGQPAFFSCPCLSSTAAPAAIPETRFLLRLENCDVLFFEEHTSISELATVAISLLFAWVGRREIAQSSGEGPFGSRCSLRMPVLAGSARPPERVSIRIGRFPLFSISWGDFYSHLVSIRNAQELSGPPTGVAAPLIRKSSTVSIALAGTKFYWSEVQFLRGWRELAVFVSRR
jgi:hypothetical protein